jgi:hypothetical protein
MRATGWHCTRRQFFFCIIVKISLFLDLISFLPRRPANVKKPIHSSSADIFFYFECFVPSVIDNANTHTTKKQNSSKSRKLCKANEITTKKKTGLTCKRRRHRYIARSHSSLNIFFISLFLSLFLTRNVFKKLFIRPIVFRQYDSFPQYKFVL